MTIIPRHPQTNNVHRVATTDPATVAAMAAVFNADWTGTDAGGQPRTQLVLSPDAQGTLLNLINSAKSRILIETEELGYVPAIESALAARARDGVNVTIILPAAERHKANTNGLIAAGVKVLYLSKPYVHAKMILVDDRIFIGSQNFSLTSLDKNREVGISLTSLDKNREVGIILTGQDLVQTVYQVFRKDEMAAAGK